MGTIGLAAMICFACVPQKPPGGDIAEPAEILVEHGQFERVIAALGRREQPSSGLADKRLSARNLLLLGQSYQALGQYPRAVQAFGQSSEAALASADGAAYARAKAGQGRALAWQENFPEARSCFEAGLSVLGEDGNQASRAALIVASGEADLLGAAPDRAAPQFALAIDLARRGGDGLLAAEAGTGLARALIRQKDPRGALGAVAAARIDLAGLADSHDVAYAWLGLGRIFTEVGAALPEQKSANQDQAESAWREAARIGEAINDRRALSYGYGYLGEAAEGEGRIQDSLSLTRRAIFYAQEIDAWEALFPWEWRLARLLAASGQPDAAAEAYSRAVDLYVRLRQEVCEGVSAQNSIMSQDVADRLFRGYADLLVRQAAAAGPESSRQALLAARDVLEMHKSVELQNYFQDPCVTQLVTKKTNIEDISPNAAVLYPIVFPDRLELILSLRGTITRKSVPIDAASFRKDIKAFRRTLEERHSFAFKEKAQKLYALLIAPLSGDLADTGIDTLIIVPDGPLRLIPMAALHDGKGFLIERFAVVTTPGLNLTAPRPLTMRETKILLVGLSQPVQGYGALPKVREELEGLAKMFKGKALFDDAFRRERLEEILARDTYGVIHIATHGEFQSEASKSYLLTYDDRLNMDQLDQLLRLTRFRKQPVELLTLSACRTAAGDDRAALGLAGVAVKAGARSALATLWNVSDTAASALILDFYGQMHSRGASKAKALQNAQLGLLRDERYRHPYYWSPFLLIGNWL